MFFEIVCRLVAVPFKLHSFSLEPLGFDQRPNADGDEADSRQIEGGLEGRRSEKSIITKRISPPTRF